MQLTSTCGPRAMLSRFTIRRAKHYAPNWLEVRQVLFLKAYELNAVMKIKDSNFVGILSGQGKLQLLQTSVSILFDHSSILVLFRKVINKWIGFLDLWEERVKK